MPPITPRPLTPKDALQQLRGLVRNFPTQIDAARELGISVQYLRDILHEKRELTPRVLAKLGLKRVMVIEPLEPPEDREPHEQSA